MFGQMVSLIFFSNSQQKYRLLRLLLLRLLRLPHLRVLQYVCHICQVYYHVYSIGCLLHLPLLLTLLCPSGRIFPMTIMVIACTKTLFFLDETNIPGVRDREDTRDRC